MEIIIAAVVVTLLFSGCVWAYRGERDAWNGGICAETGEPWQSFDVDSSGAVGYKSGAVYGPWISYDVENPTFGNSPFSFVLAKINLVIDRKLKPAV